MSDYDGDVRLSHTADGGDIEFSFGQPVMDRGLWTAGYISLFTDSGWWGNAVSDEPEKIGCEIGSLSEGTLSNQTRLDIAEEARSALEWMVEQGIAKSVEVEAEIVNPVTLAILVTVTEPDGNVQDLRYLTNWEAMRSQT